MKQIEEKLAVAEKSVAELRQQLDAAIGQLGRFDPAAGELERAIDQQVRLQARRDVLQKRLELATAAADDLKAEMLLEKAQALRAQVRDNAAALDRARQTARAEFQKLIIRGELEAHQAATLAGMIEMHREVAPLLSQKQFLTARCQEAERASAGVKQTRAIAESRERAKIQGDVFAGNI